MTKRCLATALSVLIILAMLTVGPVQPAAATPPAWWNASYTHRLGVTIMAADALPSGYSVSVTLNHAAMVSAGTSLASGNDVRIVRWNGAAWAELDRVLAVGSSWNNASTKVYFRTQTAVSASTTDTSYYLYYGYPSAGAPPANANNVYDLWDDFSGGSLDGAKWTAYNGTGVTPSQTGGEIKEAGTTQAGDPYGQPSICSNSSFSTGFLAESSFSIVTQSAAARTQWKAEIGAGHGNGAVLDLNDQRVQYYNGGWHDVAATTLMAQTFGYHRMATAITPDGTAREFEDGALNATRTGVSDSGILCFSYGPDVGGGGETFDARFDDVVVRKYVANEPVTAFEQSAGVAVSFGMDPQLTFTVSSVAGALGCGDVTTTVASTTNAVSLGHQSSTASHPIGGQSLNVITNAVNGYTVYISYGAAMLGASSGHTFTNMGGTNASPAAWPANGTEAFGYTTESSSLSGTPARFHSNKWAALTTTTGQEIMRNTTIPGVNGDTNCIAYEGSVAANTPADAAYSTTVLYNVLPLF